MTGMLAALKPWKALIASVAGFLAALLGVVAGIIKQRRVADVTMPEQPAYSPRGTMRLHPDHLEAIEHLTRETKKSAKATEDLVEALG